jgi:alpha-acetolactate decarboxylase
MNLDYFRSIMISMIIMIIMVIACLALSAGCSKQGATAIEVQQHGAMRAVMRDGQTEARVGLVDVSSQGVIAVGALAGLEGEVTILDGKVWVARPDGDGVQISGPSASPSDQATLLTVASVARWDRVELTMEKSATGAKLEALIEQTARDHGVDTTRPFPFVIDGVAERLEIHVINGFCPHATNPTSIDPEPWRWSTDEPRSARIVGFYAADAAGVLTHHGTAIHVHAIIEYDGRVLTGHIDGLTLKPGASLQLPAAD